ncbi:MAG: chorismate mutase [bacterium]|nr:chorismate mutase [bacterium]
MIEKSLEELREQIDNIDEKIIKSIGERFLVVEKIGKLKQATGIPVQDPHREAKLLLKLNTLAQKYNVSIEVVTHIYDYLMHHSRDSQQ